MKLKLSEADLIRAINDYLQYRRNQGKLMYIRNNTGAIPISNGETKRRYIRFGDKGSPDFLVFTKRWIPYWGYELKTIAIEAKSDIGKQSKDQIKWQADFEKIGGEYHIARCLEDLIEVIG